jgi:hypothetical protein
MKFLLSALVAFSLPLPLIARPGQKTQLSPEQEQQLARDKIIVTQRTWKQIFSPYIFTGEPVFITADSVLNAWHVLFEESFVALEQRASLGMAAALERALTAMHENPAEAPEGLKEKAARRAQIVLGTAARLAGSAWSGGVEVDTQIAEQLRRVEGAEAVALPPWLPAGFGVAAIDYRVFKPTGFYTRSERLQRYYRALRWLQTVPFRARVDEEMAAMSLLAKAVWEEGTLPDLARLFQSLGGRAADADILALHHLSYGTPGEATETWRGQQEAETARMVLLSAIALPDARLLEKTVSPQRPFPQSLEVAAWLGSSLARELLEGEPAGKQITSIIENHPKVAEDRDTLYHQYLDCAEKLLTPPELDAPAFMNSLPWRRKSLNTVLAGWAQLRHTWTLQAKQDAMLLPAGPRYPGFVEPNPAYFHSLSELIIRCVKEFDELDVLSPSLAGLPADAAALIPRLEAEAEGLRKRTAPFMAKGVEDSAEHQRKLEEARRIPPELAEDLKPFARHVSGISCFIPGFTVTGVHDVDRTLADLREIAAGRRTAEMERAMKEYGRPTLRERWLNLLGVCQQLETLAHRQLRGVEPTDQEKSFIVSYGERLGGIMFYDGNSYHIPRDDAPRVASVFHQPGGKWLLAGTGRPREIRVLYPWKGEEVNCRGAVLTFHEMTVDEKMTDTEWLKALDAETPPALPPWLQPLLAPNAPPKQPGE